jgi:exopolysaccharide production protein ExoQ
MPKQFALFLCIVFILWLFARDRTLRPMTSGGLWIPFLWILLIGSRPVSLWFGDGTPTATPEIYIDGSPIDRNVFIVLISAGVTILINRQVNWRGVLASNFWIFALFVYCGISVIWSDYPFVSFKRWLKDFGNVIMVLIILTEKDRVKSVRAVFARYAYIAIPISVVFIKYFPEFGRIYNRWTYLPAYVGITTEKNALGCIALVCGIFLIWDLIEIQKSLGRNTKKVDILNRALLISMVLWLIGIAESATSLVCLVIGTSMLIGIKVLFSQRLIKYFSKYCVIIGFIIFFLYLITGMDETMLHMLGKDPTLTGRTDIWSMVLKEPINPIVGTGYESFWMGERVEHFMKTYYFRMNQAHNGYLETYLNTGLIGIFLLIAVIISAGNKMKKEIINYDSYGALFFTFYVVILIYNMTEGMFNKLSPIWLIFIMTAMSSPKAYKVFYDRKKLIKDIA